MLRLEDVKTRKHAQGSLCGSRAVLPCHSSLLLEISAAKDGQDRRYINEITNGVNPAAVMSDGCVSVGIVWYSMSKKEKSRRSFAT